VVDIIPAEFLQNLGEEMVTTLMNRIYKFGKLPEDFVQSIFTPIPKVQKADQYSTKIDNQYVNQYVNNVCIGTSILL